MRLLFVSGVMAGRTVMAFPEGDCIPLSPYQRAERLFLSLLTPTQADSWRTSKAFSVETEYGAVELGRLFDIGYWPNGEDEEFRLCVVPSDRQGRHHGRDLPEPDIWTNLLLALTHDPYGFLSVANWHRPGDRWYCPPLPGLGVARAR